MSDFDAKALIEDMLAGNTISEQNIMTLTKLITPLLDAEPNVLTVPAPITCVGDIHGQFHDMLEMFRICGRPPFTNYLFLGDYVDRGFYSVECVCLALLLKLAYPQRIFLIRGNHESR